MFGISCSPELFQKIMERILCGCDDCLNFIGDIIVYGKTKQEHDERLNKVLRVLEENSVLFNRKKFIFVASELIFLGHRQTASGQRKRL